MSDSFFDQVVKNQGSTGATNRPSTKTTAAKTTAKPQPKSGTPKAAQQTSALPRVQAGRHTARLSTLMKTEMKPSIAPTMKPTTIVHKESLIDICPTDHEEYDINDVIDGNELTPLQAALVFGEVLNNPKFKK